jgi:hypothetical protein
MVATCCPGTTGVPQAEACTAGLPAREPRYDAVILIPEWLAGDVFVPGVSQDVYDEQLYRAMDFLLVVGEELQQSLFFATADLFDLDVDLLLYDTTSVYLEMEGDDEQAAELASRWDAFEAGEGPRPTRPRPQVVNDPPLRRRGYSRDHRPDLAQVVVGLAVTREGSQFAAGCGQATPTTPTRWLRSRPSQ